MLNSELCWMDGWMEDTWKRINLTNFFKLLPTARANRRSYLHFSLLLENGTENQVKLVRKAGHTDRQQNPSDLSVLEWLWATLRDTQNSGLRGSQQPPDTNCSQKAKCQLGERLFKRIRCRNIKEEGKKTNTNILGQIPPLWSFI